jgi:hypothetical protein
MLNITKRYHKNIYFPFAHYEILSLACQNLNRLNWSYSSHALDTIKERSLFYEQEITKLLLYIKDLSFSGDNIFEYYTCDDKLTKICFRYHYDNKNDVIIVITPDKKLITIYFNGVDDKHYTLNKDLYEKRPDKYDGIWTENFTIDFNMNRS